MKRNTKNLLIILGVLIAIIIGATIFVITSLDSPKIEDAVTEKVVEQEPKEVQTEVKKVDVSETQKKDNKVTEEKELEERKEESDSKEEEKHESGVNVEETEFDEDVEVETPGQQTPTNNTGNTDYEKFESFSIDEKREFINTFESEDDFFDWYVQAKKEYENSREIIEIIPGQPIQID